MQQPFITICTYLNSVFYCSHIRGPAWCLPVLSQRAPEGDTIPKNSGASQYLVSHRWSRATSARCHPQTRDVTNSILCIKSAHCPCIDTLGWWQGYSRETSHGLRTHFMDIQCIFICGAYGIENLEDLFVWKQQVTVKEWFTQFVRHLSRCHVCFQYSCTNWPATIICYKWWNWCWTLPLPFDLHLVDRGSDWLFPAFLLSQ